MELISDFLVLSAALGTAVYCAVLSRRLRRFTDLEHGVGGAVAVLSAQVDDLSKALAQTRAAAEETRSLTVDRVRRAEAAARKLEMLVASLHDLDAVAQSAKTQEAEA